MRFEVSERIQTSHSRDQILASLEEQFRKIASFVGREGDTLLVKSVEATFGSINRSDTSVISVRQAEGGFLVVAEVDYSPSIAFWFILALTCCSTFFWILPIAFYLYQRKTVRTAIVECFERVRNEHSTGHLAVSSFPGHSVAAPLSLPVPSESERQAPAEVMFAAPTILEAPVPLSAGADWYYSKDGKGVGPHTDNDLATMIASRALTRDDMMWQAGWKVWVPLHATALARHLPGPAPKEPLRLSTPSTDPRVFLIGGYCLAILIPFVGLCMGIYLLVKRNYFHGGIMCGVAIVAWIASGTVLALLQ